MASYRAHGSQAPALEGAVGQVELDRQIVQRLALNGRTQQPFGVTFSDNPSAHQLAEHVADLVLGAWSGIDEHRVTLQWDLASIPGRAAPDHPA